ncbi:substrate-binding domain-containing protein [Variovorax sp. LjRoot130]|uniref:LacI family DNA-binding transcriptional regulator n=1 Tax=Variovorax sp. LjRoot130 TaxID=3342261 RepID=UPI003ECD0475
MSAVGIHDVARLAGVSISTASRALNRTGRVSSATIKKVGDVAAKLGYQPNAIARTMRSKQSHAVGIIVSDISNPFYGRLVKSVERRLSAQGYALFVASSNNDIATEVQLIRFFKSRKVDGIILGPCQTDSVAHVINEVRDISTVLFDRDGGQQLGAVKVDHYRGTTEALEYLIGLGHKHIALMTPGSQIQPIRDRVQAYQDCLTAAGLAYDPSLICFADSSMNFPTDQAARMLARKDRPTAFLCLGTRILAGVLAAMRSAKLSIPGNVSIVSIGDTEFSELHSPSITALAWDIRSLSDEISSMLLTRMHNEAPEVQSAVVDMRLIERESCAAPEA